MTTQRKNDRPPLPRNPDGLPVPPIWTRRDQKAIGGTACVCLIALGIWCYRNGGWDWAAERSTMASPRAVDLQLHWSTLTWPELTLVPGIGETLARRIIAQRDRHGILTRQILAEVRGIGETKLAALLQHVTVAPTEAIPGCD